MRNSSPPEPETHPGAAPGGQWWAISPSGGGEEAREGQASGAPPLPPSPGGSNDTRAGTLTAYFALLHFQYIKLCKELKLDITCTSIQYHN